MSTGDRPSGLGCTVPDCCGERRVVSLRESGFWGRNESNLRKRKIFFFLLQLWTLWNSLH